MAAQVFETKVKDPADRLDYLINWQPEDVAAPLLPFLDVGDVITASTWVAYTDKWVETDELTIDDDSSTDTTATAWVTGGVAGKKYFITNHVVAASGREKDLSIKIDCKEQ